MADLLRPNIALIEDSPELKSYVYQQLAEFEPYVTPKTVVAVIAKDPRKLALQYESEGKDFDLTELSKMYRISISLSEADSRIEAEAVHADIFVAVKMAKESLLKKLAAIHDSLVSQQDRLVEINHFLQHPVLH